jgi:FlaG/FlaF family flagellin (archaellin)
VSLVVPIPFSQQIHKVKITGNERTMAEQREQALSENFAVILMVILIVIATLLLIASLNGVMTKILQKPALISVQANQFDTTDGRHIIILYHQQGDPVILNGTSQTDGVSMISISLSSSGGAEQLISLTPISTNAWHSGEMLYVYRSAGGRYGFSDVAPVGVASLEPGTWTITIQDDKVHVLLHSLPVTIR